MLVRPGSFSVHPSTSASAYQIPLLPSLSSEPQDYVTSRKSSLFTGQTGHRAIRRWVERGKQAHGPAASLTRRTGQTGGQDGQTPCGMQNCTLRRVLEYLPQSTLTHSARRRRASGKDQHVRAPRRPGTGRQGVWEMPMAEQDKDFRRKLLQNGDSPATMPLPA